MENKTSIIITAVDKTEAALKTAQANVGALEGSFNRLSGVVSGFAALAGVTAFGGIIKGAVEAAADLHDLSQRTGATVESLSAMKGAAKLAGVEMEQVAGGLTKLSKNMLEASQGSGDAAKVFNALGLSVTDSAGKLKSSDAMMLEFAKSLQTVGSSTERAAAAQMVLGKSGAQLLPMLNDLANMGELQAKVTAAQAAAADDLADNITRLGTVHKAWVNIVAMEVVPAADAFVKALLETAKGADGTRAAAQSLASDGSIKEWAVSAAKGAGFVVDAMDGVVRTVKLAGMAFAGVGKDIETFVKVATLAAGAGFTEEGQAAIKAALRERQQFISAMNDDMDAMLNKKLFSDTLAEQIEKIGKEAPVAAAGTLNLAGALAKAGDAAAKAAKELANLRLDAMARLFKELQAELDGIAKQQEAYGKAVAAALDPLEKQAAALEREVMYYGMTEAAIQAVIIQRMEEARAIAAANGAFPEHLAYLDQEIELRKRIATASSQKEFLDTNKKAAGQAAKEWEKFADDINRALTDALMRGFEDGKSFGQNFVDSLKNSLKTAALKIVVQMVTSTGGSLANAGINVLAGTSGSNGGAGTNYLGLANNASSAYNLYSNAGLAYQYASGTMSGANALGTGYANLTGTGLDGLLATNGAYGTAAPAGSAAGGGGASAATAGLGYFAIAAAAIMAIKYFNDRSRPLPLEYTGMSVDGQYDGKNFDGTLATNYMQGGSYWDQRMQLTNDAAIVAQNYQNLKPPVIEIANPDYTTWQNAYQEAGFQNQIGDNAYRTGEEIVYAPSKISGYDAGYTPAPYSTDPTVLGNIDAAIEAAFNAPKAAMKKVAEMFGDSELVTKIEAFTSKINVSGQTIGEILGKIGTQVTTDLGQAFLPAVEAARVQGAALRTGLETAIANATTAGDTAAVQTLQAQMAAIGIVAAETWNQTFERVLKETNAVSIAMDLLGVKLKDIGDANKVLTLSDNLVTLFGSIDAMNTSINAYYGNFYTEAEKQERAWKGMGEAFKSMNLTMPTTREGFRDLVEAQDMTTVAGQQTFVALMNVQSAFADLVPVTAAVVAETVNLKDTLAEMIEGLKTAVQDAMDSVTAAYDRDVDNVNSSYEATMKPVQAAIDAAQKIYDDIAKDVQAKREAAQRELDLVMRDVASMLKPINEQISGMSAKIAAENDRYNAEMQLLADERKAATKAYNDAIKGLPDAIDKLRSAVDKVKALRDSLTGTLDGLRIQGSEASYRTDAQAQIRNALAVARSTGVLPESESLSSALSTISQPSEDLFATFEDYARDFYRTAIDIRDLSDIAGDQLSVTEPQLATLEAMRDTLETNYAAQTAAFDAQQETLTGIHDTLLKSLESQLKFWEDLKKIQDDRATLAQEKYNTTSQGLDDQLYAAAEVLKAALAPLNTQKETIEKDWAAELAALKATYDEAVAAYKAALKIDENIGTLAGNIITLANAIAGLNAGTGDKGTTANPTPLNQWVTSGNVQSFLDPLGASANRFTSNQTAAGTIVTGKDKSEDTVLGLANAGQGLLSQGDYAEIIAAITNKGISSGNAADILNQATTPTTTVTGTDVTNWGADKVAGYTKTEIKTWVNDQLAAGNARAVYDRAVAEGISSSTLDGVMGWSLGTSLKWATDNGLPAFAKGTNYVPNDMVAKIHAGERIIPAADNSLLMSMLNNGGRREEALVEEIKALRQEVKQLREENMAAQTSIATNTRKSAQIADQWNIDGMPEVRV